MTACKHRTQRSATLARSGAILLAGTVALAPLAASAQVEVEAAVNVVYQVADTDQVDPELSASADVFLTIPRSNGEWLIYIEGSTAPDANGVSSLFPTANADAGSVLNSDGDGGVQISEFNYTFRFDNESTLMLGLIDPSAYLDRSRITNDENLHFLNGSFVNNATIEFPDYAIGGVFVTPQSGSRPELTFLVSGSDGIADLPDRSYQDLVRLNSDGRGAFVGAGAKWAWNGMSARIGGWFRTDDTTVIGDPGNEERNYGAYAVWGWQGEKHALNVRIGAANDDVSVANRFAAVAYEYPTAAGLFGAAVARTTIADTFQQRTLENTTTAEMFFRIPLGQAGRHITPSIQYVENPGFDGTGAGVPLSAVVGSLRFHWGF